MKLSEIISWLKKTIQENLFPHPRECFDDPLTEKQPESLPHEVLYIKRKQQKQHFRKAAAAHRINDKQPGACTFQMKLFLLENKLRMLENFFKRFISLENIFSTPKIKGGRRMNIKTFFNVYVLMLIICLFFVPDAYSQSTPYAGEWKGDTWCTNPPEKKKQFRFDIWVENNVIKAKDYSAQNKFKPCIISNDGNLHCPWYRSNSDAHGTYIFYIDKNDPNLMRGHENTQNIKCKQYGYELRR